MPDLVGARDRCHGRTPANSRGLGTVGDEVFDATTGEFVWLSRDVPHTFPKTSP